MDPTPLWDFENPAASLHRFVAARAEQGGAQPDDAILATQQARALGLLARYDEAHAVLDAIRCDEPEARVRGHLERGRLQRTAETGDRGRAEFEAAERAAYPLRDSTPFGGLYVDALHMLALLTDEPDEQIRRGRLALKAAAASADPAAQRWRASLLNNIAMAHHGAGDDEAALTEFRQAYVLREAAGQRREAQVARWMIAWTLRLLGRFDEARDMQTELREELTADGVSDGYVAKELALIERGSTADE